MSEPLRAPIGPEEVIGVAPHAPPAAGPAAADSREDMDRSLIGGVAWTGIAKTGGQTIAWASTLVVARILSPNDYGVMGMAMLYLGLLQLVSEFGIGMAVVNHRDLTRDDIAQLNTVSLGIGFAGTALVALTAPIVSHFFHNPRLTPVLAVLSVTFLISSVKSVPWGLLQRDFQFKRLAVYDGLQAVGLAILTVALAWLGFRYWTLVIAAVASALAGTVIAVWLHAVPFQWPDFKRLRRVLQFSSNIVVQRITWYGYSNSDFLVGGRMLGAGPLGLYTFAWDVSHISDKVTAILLQVTPSVFARVQNDPEALRRYLMRITEILSLTVTPAMIGLALVAPEFVRVVLGAKWSGMIIPLQLLTGYGALIISAPLMNQVLNATGHEVFGARNNTLQLLVLPPAFVAGAWLGGVDGLALALVLVHPFVTARLARYTLRVVDLRATTFFHDAIWPGLSGCIAMVLIVTFMRQLMPPDVPDALKLVLEIAVGMMTYIGAVFALHGAHVRGILASAQTLAAGES